MRKATTIYLTRPTRLVIVFRGATCVARGAHEARLSTYSNVGTD